MIIFFRKKNSIHHYVKQGLSHVGRLTLMIACLVISAFSNQLVVKAEENLDMYSGSYALTDAITGRVLAGKEEMNPMANASTTKILTCIVTLENSDINEMVTISNNASTQPRVRLGMGEGEQYPLKDMLYGLMLESYNDCAVAIAEHVAGSEKGFAELMNKKAKKIGCQDTYFITPNGLDREDEISFHHTTAQDLCKIMAYCTWESPMKDTFLQITQTRNYNGTANGNNYSFTNHNAFLGQMEGVLTGKTGFTNKAGYCYVAALEKNGERYCIALLACGWPNNKTYKWHDARVLFEHGLENYDMKTVELDALEERIFVDGYVGKPSFMNLNQTLELQVSANGREYQILLAEDEALEAEVVLYTDTELPIHKGQKLGVCNIYLEDMLIDSFDLMAQEKSDKWNLLEIIKLIFGKFLTFSI